MELFVLLPPGLVSLLPVWSPFPFLTKYHLCPALLPQAPPPPHDPFVLVPMTLHVVHSHLKIGVGTTGEREQAASVCLSGSGLLHSESFLGPTAFLQVWLGEGDCTSMEP